MDAWELRSSHCSWKESSDCLSLKLQNCLHIGTAAPPVIYWQNFWNGGFKTEKQAWTTARWWFIALKLHEGRDVCWTTSKSIKRKEILGTAAT